MCAEQLPKDLFCNVFARTASSFPNLLVKILSFLLRMSCAARRCGNRENAVCLLRRCGIASVESRNSLCY
jgi:hypothetical protein